ncbi:protein kinase domain-containing protein [Microbulbifer harenosus]|uniref:Tetratricopeptide repeat protein n=1 Tax=Microbulbifer harenosus TaxID=2576840 RepID=A0ABY2UH78_9GAMM|nr:serine/threonine-protein kinase [Microbulbifer harenosus]TLM74410.1 tetratricopeptide repeat protein [Microbulbifer harenosus]
MDIADSEVGRHASAPNKLVVDSDRYVIHSTLGAGGMGIVYLAEDLKLHRQVAIKKLKDDVASQNARDRIQQEARLLAQLNHPNIVALYDVLEENGSVALVMEYIEGASLRAWMRERTPSLQQKLSLLMQISLGLQQAHDLGIIHRDLKPDNILITENAKGQPTAKITDFGIAKSQQLDEKTLTAENQLAGTVTAMSPEQILGKALDARSDLFSLGTIAYELLCGSRPFEKHEAGALAMANRITNEPHQPPQQAWPSIPEPLAILLDKLLAKDPAQRPESALIVHQGFALLHKQGLDTEAEDYTATLTDLFTRQQVKSRRRWQRVAAGIVAALVVSAGGYWGWKEITRLEPQYIAVMPVEINGEIRGEENAKALTRTMVRQALMNSVSQLKASALVSFEPKEGMDFEEQLQALRDKGVTDALFARLECAEVRCEIELQRISTKDSQIGQQSNFAFLTNKEQEAEYRVTNSASALFPADYFTQATKQISMSDQAYNQYLDILSRLDRKDLNSEDLSTLEALINQYPLNSSLYQAYTSVSAKLFVQTDRDAFIERGLAMLEKARTHKIDSQQLLEQEIRLHTYNVDSEKFDELLNKADQQKFPSAALIAKFSRYLFTRGDYKAGLKYAQAATALNPSADNLYLIALNQISSGNYSDARLTLGKIISIFPEHWSSYSALGVIELESGNFFEAEKAITTIPENLRSWRTRSNLGVVYFLQLKHKPALQEFLGVLQLIPDDPGTIGQIAETYLMAGDQKSARQYYQRLIALTEGSDDLEARQFRALGLANLDRETEAINLVNTMLRQAPDDTYVIHVAAQVFALTGEFYSAGYQIEQLIRQGMSVEWFNLPVFHQLCAQPQVSDEVKSTICN